MDQDICEACHQDRKAGHAPFCHRYVGPRVLVVTQHDIDQCPNRQLDPGHYRPDGTCLHRNSHATDAFTMNWQNDYDLYQAALRLGAGLRKELRHRATREVLGDAVIRLFRPRAEAAAEADNLFGIMHRDVGNWDDVDPGAVGDEVLDLLQVEQQ